MAGNESWLTQGRQSHGHFGDGTAGLSARGGEVASWAGVFEGSGNWANFYGAHQGTIVHQFSTDGGTQSDEPQFAANDGPPRNNQAQNAQVDAVVRILGLSPDQRQQLHREISGQGLGFYGVLERAKEMFGK